MSTRTTVTLIEKKEGYYSRRGWAGTGISVYCAAQHDGVGTSSCSPTFVAIEDACGALRYTRYICTL